jgi:hypothetical protein
MHVNYELVSREYYKDELSYQEVIDATNRAGTLSGKIQLSQKNDSILVQMPPEMKNEKVTGSMWFYCASDEKRDRHISIGLNTDASQQINKKTFLSGSYIVKFDWESNHKHYHSEEPITIH